MTLSTHAAKLERWLGAEATAQLSENVRTWYGPPIPVAGVPGKVYACKGGDFRGRIDVGIEANAKTLISNTARKAKRYLQRVGKANDSTLGAGFASLSALINAGTVNGYKQDLPWQKTGPTVVVNGTSQLWQVGPSPAAGAAGAAAPGGTAQSSATTGAIPFANAPSTLYNCLVSAFTTASLQNSLLLYDRLFAVAKTMNSTATEAVSGVPTRYTGTTANTFGYSGGNFLFPVTGLTALANTAHNWTVCQYTSNTGATAQSAPSVAGNPGAVATIIHRVDLPVGTWFMPLNGSDTGLTALTQMQCSALVATGLLDFVIGHPIAFIPVPLANVICNYDGINTAFNLARVFDNACLSHLVMPPPAVTATTFGGSISIVAG